jgi:hypothetical protein
LLSNKLRERKISKIMNQIDGEMLPRVIGSEDAGPDVTPARSVGANTSSCPSLTVVYEKRLPPLWHTAAKAVRKSVVTDT